MKLKTLNNLDVKGKVVLLRSDLNSDIVKKKVLLGERIRESAKTIKALKKAGGKVVIIAHQGNVGKGNFLGLAQHAKLLNKFVKVKFVNDVVGTRAISAIKKMRGGDVILLDNVRKVKDEFAPRRKGNVLIKKLLPLCDVYINDAFSVSHRSHTSIVGFAGKVPSGIGLLLEKEIRALEKVSMKNCLFILGGAKPQTDIKLLGRKNKVIVCGLFGQMCLAAKGMDFGYQNKFLERTVLMKENYGKFLKKLKRKLKNAQMPLDFAVDFKGKRKEFQLKKFPINYEIEDLGGESIKKFVKIIGRAKAVYMKGPAGWAEDKRFARGTVEILKAVTSCKGFSLVGGGQLSEVMNKYRIGKKRFGHVSLSGGATLAFVAGERLVGLEALGYY
jgi:phosphoglycerate kinase